MSSSAACMPGWSRSSWGAAVIAAWPPSSTSILTPWRAEDSSCWRRMWRWIVRAKRAAGAGGWKKNARNNRCHRDYPGARYGRRSHHGVEVDPEDDGENSRTSATDRYSGFGQYRFSPAIPDGFLASCEPKADRHQLQSVPGAAVPAYFFAAGAI